MSVCLVCDHHCPADGQEADDCPCRCHGGGLRVLCFGSRHFDDLPTVRQALLDLHPTVGLVIEGEGKGADRLCRFAALELGLPVMPVAADWRLRGRAGGPMRNRSMLNFGIDLALSFQLPGRPLGAGSTDMTLQLERADVPYRLLYPGERLTQGAVR